MKISDLYSYFKKNVQKIDWKLLLFLLLFLNVKLIIKVLAVILIYALNNNFKFGFKLGSSRLPLFYLIVIGVACLNLFLYKLFQNINYDTVFITGICIWVMSILAIHQLKLFTEKIDSEIILKTLVVFFVINSLASLVNLLSIVVETGAINPYRYQGMFQKYFIGTGDHIKGISFDTSTTNALLNAFGIVYFLKHNKLLMVLLCMCVLLLTGSNTTNILILLSLFFIFIFKSTGEQKSIIVVCICLFVIFMGKISPQNNEYGRGVFKKFFPTENKKVTAANVSVASVLSPEVQKQKIAQKKLDKGYSILQQKGLLDAIISNAPKIKPSIPQPDINAPEYQNRNDTNNSRRELIVFTKKHQQDSIALTIKDDWQKKPGKLISAQQTLSFFQRSPKKIITGNGMGCFSSKLAFRATALKLSGGYPEKISYINEDFANNHLAVFLYFFTKQRELHSVANTPDSVYNQLMGEYGLAGIAAFLIFYIFFFIKRLVKLIDAIPFLFIMISAFAFGYWFEQLSVVPFFELLMFLNIKENNLSKHHDQ